jgi:DNA-binding response OmpR family regulator
MTLKVLVAEDARDIAEAITFTLRMVWPDSQVSVACDGVEALESFHKEPVDLVVLDVAMPPPDGLEVCRRIRKTSSVPILMLTARDATFDKVRGLEAGADDYLVKPFDHMELVARLRALIRRVSGGVVTSDRAVTVGDLCLNLSTHEVRLRGELVLLSSTEYRLLAELARHPGIAIPHRRLLEQIWGVEYVDEVQYLKVLVGRLRRKLGDDAEQSRYIQTERGIGYRLVPHVSPRQ